MALAARLRQLVAKSGMIMTQTEAETAAMHATVAWLEFQAGQGDQSPTLDAGEPLFPIIDAHWNNVALALRNEGVTMTMHYNIISDSCYIRFGWACDDDANKT